MATLKKPELRTNAREESLRDKVKSPSTGASSREPKTAAPISSRSPASEDKRKGVNERPVQLSYDASDNGYDEETRPAKVKPVRPSADPYDEDGELREIWERNQKTAAPRPSTSVIGPVAEDPLDRELKKTWDRMQAQPSAGGGPLFGAPPTPSSDWRGALASDAVRFGSDPLGRRSTAYGTGPGTQVAQAAPGAGQVLQNDAVPGLASTMPLAPEVFGERYFGTPSSGQLSAPDWTLGGILSPGEADLLRQSLAGQSFDPTFGGRQAAPGLADIGISGPFGPATPAPSDGASGNSGPDWTFGGVLSPEEASLMRRSTAGQSYPPTIGSTVRAGDVATHLTIPPRPLGVISIQEAAIPPRSLRDYFAPSVAESHFDLDEQFATNLQRFADAAPGRIEFYSGYRSIERQTQLYNQKLAEVRAAHPDWSEAEVVRHTRLWVAPPGNSHHNYGLAVDLRFENEETAAWAHEHAAEYGLQFPLSNEAWHIEPLGPAGGRVPLPTTEGSTPLPPLPRPRPRSF